MLQIENSLENKAIYIHFNYCHRSKYASKEKSGIRNVSNIEWRDLVKNRTKMSG